MVNADKIAALHSDFMLNGFQTESGNKIKHLKTNKESKRKRQLCERKGYVCIKNCQRQDHVVEVSVGVGVDSHILVRHVTLRIPQFKEIIYYIPTKFIYISDYFQETMRNVYTLFSKKFEQVL